MPRKRSNAKAIKVKEENITKRAPHKAKAKTLAPLFVEVVYTELARTSNFGNYDIYNHGRRSWHQLRTGLTPLFPFAPNWAEHSRAQAADARTTMDARSASMVDGMRGVGGRDDGRDGEHPKTVVTRKTCAVGVSKKATFGDQFR